MQYQLNFTNSFRDKRIVKRASSIMENILERQSAIIRAMSTTDSAYKAATRFFNNPQVCPETIISSIQKTCQKNCDNHHILVIQDTTEINYQKHYNFLDIFSGDLGPTGNDKDLGFFIHAGLAIDAELQIPIGFSYVKTWNRDINKKDKHERNYKYQPIEEKESYRWIECGMRSKEVLHNASQLTIIGDRESDIYEEIATVPDQRTHVLIRSCRDRKLVGTDVSVYEELERQEVSYEYKVKVRGTSKRKARQATLTVRFCPVVIKKPLSSVDKLSTDQVSLFALEVREKNCQDLNDEICWHLLTTHPVTNIQQALQVIKWYALRWQIELIFGLLKTQAFNIEACQLEKGKALKTIAAMALQSTLKIQQLKMARDGDETISASIIFDESDLPLMEKINTSLEGKTEKQKNPFKPHSLPWASWIIARLGGWLGGQDKPGSKTYSKGLEKFETIVFADKILKN